MCGRPGNLYDNYEYAMKDRDYEYSMCITCTISSLNRHEENEKRVLANFMETCNVLDVSYDAYGLPVDLPAGSTDAQKTAHANLKRATNDANAARATYKRMLTGTLKRS